MTTQIKIIGWEFPVVLSAKLYKVVLIFESVDEILKCDHSNESYWAVLSCGAVCYAIQGGLTFESVDEILKCDHSNESYWAVLSCAAVCYAVQGGLTFETVDEVYGVTIQMKATEQYFPVLLFIVLSI